MILPSVYRERFKIGQVSKTDLCTVGCLNPVEVSVTDSASGEPRVMVVNCGRCPNCRNQRRNEWVTRMCLHSLSWKHCYFVTLTYNSVDMTVFKSHPFLADWYDTVPSLDSYNSKGIPCWTPSLLCRSHIVKFFKRLRINTGAEISYVYCGEYGGKFGRPHFHAIIWSQQSLSKKDIEIAWSYKCVKTDSSFVIRPYRGNTSYFLYRIGRVDFVDLVANGTLDWDAKEIQKDDKRCSRFCFSYVAKYLGKNDSLFDTSNRIALWRINKAWTYYSWCDSDSDKDSFEYFSDTYSKNVKLNGINYEKISYQTFLSLVSPFFGASRLYSIGKLYALQNMSRFDSSNYALPEFQGKKLVFPTYFRHLQSLSRFPLRLEKCVLSGRSFVKGQFKDLLVYFRRMAEDRTFIFDLYNAQKFPFRDLFNGVKPLTDYTSPSFNGSVLVFCFVRPNGVPVHYSYDVTSDVFLGYIWNRHFREYDFFEYVERADLCSYICSLLSKEIDNFASSKEQLLIHTAFERDVKRDLIDGNCDSECHAAVVRYLDILSEFQSRYKSKHVTETQ